MEKEFVVSFVTSQQITECNWNVRTPSLKIKPETTVEEIKALKFVRAEPKYTDGMSAMDVDKLIEDFTDYIDRNY